MRGLRGPAAMRGYFVGLLVAVPIAAAIGVLVRFAINQYRAGLLYRGYSTGADDDHGAP